MKKILLISVVSCVVGVTLGTAAAFYSFGNAGPDLTSARAVRPTGKPGPDPRPDTRRLSIDVLGGEEYDFGVMDRGEKRSHTFRIRNNTLQTLDLTVASTTCMCTVGELDRDSVPPGEIGDVTLEWTAKSLDPEFRHSATIGTSHSSRKHIVLTVFGRVLQSVRAVPSDVAFSDVTIHQSREASFVLYGFKDGDLRIVGHDWLLKDTAEFYEFQWEPAGDDVVASEPDALSAVRCTVRMASGQPLGPIRQLLSLTTTSTGGGVIDIPIQGRIVGDVSISGANFLELTNLLRLGPIRQDKLGAQHRLFMTVKGPYREEFEVTEIRVQPEAALRVEITPPRSLRDGLIKLYQIRVEVPVGAPPVNYSGGEEHPLGEIMLVTNHPEIGTIKLQVEFAVTE